jgi:predicted ATP-dependent endonuclease of OLD family
VISIIEFSEVEKSWLESYFVDNKNICNLNRLSKINIFIGQNNTGKSRFLRNIFHEGIYNTSGKLERKYISCGNADELKLLVGNFNIDLVGSKNNNYNSANNDYKRLKSKEYEKSFNNFYEHVFYNIKNTNHLKYYKTIESLLLRYINNHTLEERKINQVYIPILRGMKPLNLDYRSMESYNKDLGKKNIHKVKFNEDNVYKFRIFRDYFNNDLYDFVNKNIFTGLSIYNDLKDKLLGNLNERNLVREYEEFLSKELFNGKNIVLIPHREKDVVCIKIGNQLERPLYELGDGMQSIIISTYAFFIYKDSQKINLFFIEEPEMYLHPEMQRKFLSIMNNSIFKNHQYFFTTHSNHIMDMTSDFDDISVYLFKEKNNENLDENSNEYSPKFVIENVSKYEIRILNELGVKNSSVLLSNCTIWVEGITDRLYIREYLRIYQLVKYKKIKYKEDKHYSFVEYGGNNITHWSFLDNEDDEYPNIDYKKITNKIFLIADYDSENDDSKKNKRFENIKEHPGENFYKLDVVEIENLIHEKYLKKIIFYYENKKNDFKDFKDTGFEPIDFTQKDYKRIHLGDFIDRGLKNRKRNVTYADSNYKTGTIRDKVRFSKKICDYMRADEGFDNEDKFEDYISESSVKLAEKIINFIENS